MRKHLFAQSRGSVESFLTIIPQVFVFLVMFQLVFMQFNLMSDTHLSQGEVSKIAISGGNNQYERYPLVGGGSVLVRSKVVSIRKFLDFNHLSFKKITSIAVDEDESN